MISIFPLLLVNTLPPIREEKGEDFWLLVIYWAKDKQNQLKIENGKLKMFFFPGTVRHFQFSIFN